MKWLKRDKKEFARLRKLYNAKVTRLNNKNWVTPDKIYIDDVKDLSRSDYNKTLQEMKDFLKKGSEYYTEYKGYLVPGFEKKKVERQVRSISQQMSYKKRQLSMEKGNTKVAEKENLVLPNFKNYEQSLKYLDKKYYDRNKSADYELYKENYLQAIKNTGRVDSELYKMIEQMNAEEVFNKIYDDGRFTINWYYTTAGMDDNYNRLVDLWSNQGV